MNFVASRFFSNSIFFCLSLLIACKSTQIATQESLPAQTTEAQSEVPPSAATEAVSPVPAASIYQSTRTLVNDLIHTKLEVSFDWEQQHLLGTAILEFTPYFYPQSRLTLDAKGFDIHAVNLVEGSSKKSLNYSYDNLKLDIDLGSTYPQGTHYFVEIAYTAKPNELAEGGSAAITSDKGLYFINPDGSEPDKPRQIWTQGETQANSAWFPTIDSPNERTTQEIYITVQDNFQTLSNGQLVFSRSNGDGTRTDYWKMDQSHAPYLFMMAIGEFAIVKEDWQGMEVSYYVEPAYEKYAKDIFGNTPEMLTFFSEKLNYKYPWNKYSQVVVRDYVSGAMENTTASVFMEQLQVDDRTLIDEDWDGIIAHELFHQWFGDLVTCESWSNLTLNEGFANYSEYLWAEYKHGREEADYLGQLELQGYLGEAQEKQVDLIRFDYDDKEDMFDAHSYNKGGRVIHMLRNHVGDEAFFKSLEYYLKANQYQPVEIHNLRLAFEHITGEDLNWFFNQWFLESGHPQLEVQQQHSGDSLILEVRQVQDFSRSPLYKLPLEVAVWSGGQRQLYPAVLDQAYHRFAWPQNEKPDLVAFDPEKALLGEIQFPQTRPELSYQFDHSPYVVARYQALELLLADSLVDETLISVLTKALDDSFWGIRQLAANAFAGYTGEDQTGLEAKLTAMATKDKKSLVREAVITTLSSFASTNEHIEIYRSGLSDQSYSAAGAALLAYLSTDAPDKEEMINKYKDEESIHFVVPLAEYFVQNKAADKYPWFQAKLDSLSGEQLFYFISYFSEYLLHLDEIEMSLGVKKLEEFARAHPTYYIRYAGYQALGIHENMEGVIALRKEIKAQEQDARLKAAYDRMP